MDRMCSEESSIGDVLGGFVHYKINWYKNKIDVGVKRMRGETVCDSDIIMADLLEPQYFINSLQDKLISSHRYITEPFKQTYAIKEIKNAITDRLSLGTSDFSKIHSLPNDLSGYASF